MLKELLNINNITGEDYLIKLYINLISLKNKIEEELIKKEGLECKKIRRKFL